jgi:REP element-mobilizing transposase RayT
MAKTLGYHIVISGYGLWLPGDSRGSWSEKWDEQLGFIEPHMLHPGDPVRLRMAKERMKHPRVILSDAMADSVVLAIGQCAAQSDWRVIAAAIEPSHTHLMLSFTRRDIDSTVKWLKDQATKAIHRETLHKGPVWCKGKWCSFIFDEVVWLRTKTYIELHNVRRGMDVQPYDWIAR